MSGLYLAQLLVVILGWSLVALCFVIPIRYFIKKRRGDFEKLLN